MTAVSLFLYSVSSYTHKSFRRESIALTLVSKQLLNLSGGSQRSTPSLTTGRYIKISFLFKSTMPIVFQNPKNCNWAKYYQILSQTIAPQPSDYPQTIESSNTLTQEFTQAKNNALRMACPRTKPKKEKYATLVDYSASNPPCSIEQKPKLKRYSGATIMIPWPLTKIPYENLIAPHGSFCMDLKNTTQAERRRQILSQSATTLSYRKKEDDTWTSKTVDSRSLATLLDSLSLLHLRS